MVGGLSAPGQIGLALVRSSYYALTLWTWSKMDLLGSMTDFNASDLYYIQQVILDAVLAFKHR